MKYRVLGQSELQINNSNLKKKKKIQNVAWNLVIVKFTFYRQFKFYWCLIFLFDNLGKFAFKKHKRYI